MGLREQNSTKINSAFENAIANAKASVERGMKELLHAAMMFCLEAHDSNHQNHLGIGDSYGWILMSGSSIIDSEILIEGGEGNIRSEFARLAQKYQTNGYQGIVIAGMKPRNYFSISYEKRVMREGISTLKGEDFNKYFKPIK